MGAMDTTPHPSPPRRRRAALALVALVLGLLAATVPTPAGAVPFAPDIKGIIGYDAPGNGYHRVIWGTSGVTGGGPIDAWQVQRWNSDESILLATYDVAVGQGPDLTVPNMVDEVVYRYRVRAHNDQGWSGWGGFEPVKVNTGLRHWAPYANEGEIIRAHYRNLLGRNPSIGEESTAATSMSDAGGLVSFLNGLIGQTARTKNRYPVIRLYLAYFDRAPEPDGLDYWTDRIDAGTATLSSASSFFAGSQEYKTLYGGTTNQQFVTLVYQNVLDRDPQPSETAYWRGRLDQGTITRGKLMIGFSESPEGKELRRGDTVVADVWTALMDEEPSNSLMDTYGDHIRAGGTGGDIALFIQHFNDYPVN
jgi:hypothetical protein